MSFSLSSRSLLFCFSHGQIQSAGHGQSTPFFLCSDLFQMPLAVLALISTIKTFPLTTPWNEHTQTPNSQHEGDFITLEGGGLSLGQGTTSVSGGCVWIRGLFLGQGAVSGSGGCLWAGVGGAGSGTEGCFWIRQRQQQVSLMTWFLRRKREVCARVSRQVLIGPVSQCL